MSWPTVPPPMTARAILLLPSGHRAFDEDFTVAFPPPSHVLLGGSFELMHLHHAGGVDQDTRALYVLGGCYRPYGYPRAERHDPDEAHDQ